MLHSKTVRIMLFYFLNPNTMCKGNPNASESTSIMIPFASETEEIIFICWISKGVNHQHIIQSHMLNNISWQHLYIRWIIQEMCSDKYISHFIWTWTERRITVEGMDRRGGQLRQSCTDLRWKLNVKPCLLPTVPSLDQPRWAGDSSFSCFLTILHPHTSLPCTGASWSCVLPHMGSRTRAYNKYARLSMTLINAGGHIPSQEIRACYYSTIGYIHFVIFLHTDSMIVAYSRWKSRSIEAHSKDTSGTPMEPHF